jgi:zinc protease
MSQRPFYRFLVLLAAATIAWAPVHAAAPARSKPAVGGKGQRVALRQAPARTAPPAAGSRNAAVTAGVRETMLPNGLKVLTKEVHSAPVVAFQVWYKVGSRNEHTGITGCSHLLEHMLFKGTKRYAVGEISRTLSVNGARFNAQTSSDYTSYFETLSSDRLELAMQIESDRMVNSLIDPHQFKSEMTVVRSELEGHENDPGDLLYRAVWATAYQVHPYHWPVIGWRVEVENVPRDALYAYYKRYYGPNNATVIIVGDFDTNRALAMVRQYFGTIRPIPNPPPVYSQEPPQRGEQRVVVNRAGNLKQLMLAYHIPEGKHVDFYAMDVLSQVLSAGRSSRLYQTLVETQQAVGAYAGNPTMRDPSLFMFQATARPGVELGDLEKAMLAQIDRLKNEDVSEEELQRAKNQIVADFVYEADSVTEQATLMGRYESWTGWRYLDTYLDRVRAVTAADLRRVAQRYLTEANRTAGWFVPTNEPGSSGGGPVGEAAARAEPAPPNARPIPLPKRSPALTRQPRVTRTVLDNGVVIIVSENRSNPTVALQGNMATAGGNRDPADRPGLASMTAGMLSRGTERRSSLEIARELESTGAATSFSAGDDALSFTGAALAKDFDRMLAVLADEMRHPTFPVAELDKLRQQSLAGLQRELEDPDAQATRAFQRAIFPAGHPNRPPSVAEEEASLKAMTRDELAAFYRRHYGPDAVILVIAGDVSADQAVAAVRRHLGDWAKNPDAPRTLPPDPPLQERPIRDVIPMPDKSEVAVYYGFAGGLKRSDPDFYATQLMNNILGGGTGLENRLARRIRDQQGLVYTVYSYFDAGKIAGPFTVNLGTNPANTDRAIASLEAEVKRMREQGATDRERQEALAFLTGYFPVRLEANAGLAGVLLVAEYYGLGMDYIRKYASYYEAVTTSQVNEAAKKHLHPDRATVVIAGSVPTSTRAQSGATRAAP